MDSTVESQASLEALGPHKDEVVLADLGYKQEFKREFRLLEVCGIAFSIIGLFPSTAYDSDLFHHSFAHQLASRSTLALSLPNGGSVALVWGVSSPKRTAPTSLTPKHVISGQSVPRSG